jgi:curli biogenesis system outer membrane secretion channel CsgG
MRTSRRLALACLLVSAYARSQTSLDPPPPPPIDPAAPGSAGGNAGFGGQQLPYQGPPLTAPTSAAATRYADRPAVAIREFRSSVGEVPARGATDMFIAVLVKTHRFRVLERTRLAEGIAGEKALNQQGMTTGEVGHSQYIGATYVFEATISEASAGDRSNSFTLGLAGAAAGSGSTSDSIAIDVRVIDVESGVVVDAVTVRKEIYSTETRVGGFTSALANLLTKGRGSAAVNALAPDDRYVSARKDSLDKALREAIEAAVTDLALRLAPS